MEIKIKVQQQNNISVKVQQPNNIRVKFKDIITVNAEKYIGVYEYTPKAYDKQILETKNKLLNADITIKEIPYYEVSNENGGKTVIIA